MLGSDTPIRLTIEKNKVCSGSIQFFSGENMDVLNAEIESQADDMFFR